MDQVAWLVGAVAFRKALHQRGGCGLMVCICGVEHNICLAGMVAEERYVVEGSIDQDDVVNGGLEGGGFGAVADEGGDLPVWMGFGDCKQEITADIACCSCTVLLLVLLATI